MDQNKYYKTNGFYIAVFLLTNGFVLVTTEKNAANKTFFVFQNSGKLQKFVRVFNFGDENDQALNVNFKKMVAAIKKLKGLIYD